MFIIEKSGKTTKMVSRKKKKPNLILSLLQRELNLQRRQRQRQHQRRRQRQRQRQQQRQRQGKLLNRCQLVAEKETGLPDVWRERKKTF